MESRSIYEYYCFV